MSVKDKVQAIDRFVRTIKESGVYDDINAACIMAGWTNLAGALTPLKGSAPTNNGFLAADLDAGIGLKGDGSSKYLNSNRANNADGQNDNHNAVYVSAPEIYGTFGVYLGVDASLSGANNLGRASVPPTDLLFRNRTSTASFIANAGDTSGFIGMSRNASSSYGVRHAATSSSFSEVSSAPTSDQMQVFRRAAASGVTTARLSWYSIGSATDLAALDSAVSTLMADLRAIDEDGFDRSALDYIRRVEAADGSFLETGVKKAINSFIVGCKKDGIWDALKASCILCGARTIAGALVPLAGTAPTAVNFVSANYNRETGLVGVPASNTYIDTNRANNADPQNDKHIAYYASNAGAATRQVMTSGWNVNGASQIVRGAAYTARINAAYTSDVTIGTGTVAVGFVGASRSSGSAISGRNGGTTSVDVAQASTVPNAQNLLLYQGQLITDARIAFYSIGSAISDLALLDARVTTLVSQIAAAIP